MENEQQQRFQDYEVKLQCSEDVNRQTIGELRKLLQAQQRMSARYVRSHCISPSRFQFRLNQSLCRVILSFPLLKVPVGGALGTLVSCTIPDMTTLNISI